MISYSHTQAHLAKKKKEKKKQHVSLRHEDRSWQKQMNKNTKTNENKGKLVIEKRVSFVKPIELVLYLYFLSIMKRPFYGEPKAWRLYSTPSSLWARLLKAKYFPQATLFTGPRSAKRSHIWTAISLGAKLLREGMRWFVGDGHSIRVWQDHWLPNGSLREYIEGPLPRQEEDRRINSLWDNQT